jgi:hypothetical protein
MFFKLKICTTRWTQTSALSHMEVNFLSQKFKDCDVIVVVVVPGQSTVYKATEFWRRWREFCGRGRRGQWDRRPPNDTSWARRSAGCVGYIFLKETEYEWLHKNAHRPVYLQCTKCVQWPWVVKTCTAINIALCCLPFCHNLVFGLELYTIYGCASY